METLKFERTTCTRCGGTGSYSYCQRFGTTCFGCSGKGKKLTKRGAAANQWFTNHNTIKANDVKAGQRIKIDWMGTFTVESVEIVINKNCVKPMDGEWQDREVANFTSVNGKTYGTDSSADVTLILSKEDHHALLVRAIEYQSKLTKAGQLMKKFAA